MKVFKCFFFFFIFLSLFNNEELMAKGKVVPRIYMFGFSASFTDSIVYFTNIQEVDSAWIDSGSKFLMGRENYSYQLRNYLADKLKMPNRTCLVMYGKNRKDAEKKYLKMKRLYTEKSKGMYDVRFINDSNFKFATIDMSYNEGESVTTSGGL